MKQKKTQEYYLGVIVGSTQMALKLLKLTKENVFTKEELKYIQEGELSCLESCWYGNDDKKPTEYPLTIRKLKKAKPERFGLSKEEFELERGIVLKIEKMLKRGRV